MTDYNPAGLALTCTQLRQDYLKLFCASNSFVVHVVPEQAEESIAALVRGFGRENVKIIKSVVVDVDLGTYTEKDMENYRRERFEGNMVKSRFEAIMKSLFHEDMLGFASLLATCEKAFLKMRFTIEGAWLGGEQEIAFDFRATERSMRHEHARLSHESMSKVFVDPDCPDHEIIYQMVRFLRSEWHHAACLRKKLSAQD
ncbi:hypothetical protein M409DRAFT_25307 [Zasmidium cellare ATCC 36951]|uniref:Uncharacterized protein n=1 Tax=Zasmidium cellare ATCC 36951 TaxID=1080233 RepID=A0A6A6CDX6_ZASCE|nr:uncharacterized protein M409DRAFT_25307 [Zasmidium cellare ATCC 36951]KAF2164430.1 hypothetical protein M409DRAFT_25307 [Zasmidium cellare ATCC 36951]